MNGEYNRPYVSSQVFKNPDLLKKLNGIIHPAVGNDTDAWLENHRPYAKKIIETVVAGLQIEADQRTLNAFDDKIFKIRFELSKNPGSQFLQGELKKTQAERDLLQKKIDFQILKGQQGK